MCGCFTGPLRQPLPAYLFVLDVTFFVKGELLFPLALGIGAERNISMPKRDIASRQFRQKISDFCELRIAPIASKRVLENIRPYLTILIIYRKSPPLLNGRINWTAIGEACGIEGELTPELKNHLRPGLDAILRWLRMPPAAEDVRPPKPKTRSPKSDRRTPALTSSTRKPQRMGTDEAPVQSERYRNAAPSRQRGHGRQRMPLMTGLELAQAMRADGELSHIPVILVSGAQGSIGRAHPDVFDAVFDKPYNEKKLLETVSRLLS